MNKFLTVFTTLIFAVCAAAATKPFVYDTQTGNAPALNKLYRDFYIFVDMAPSPRSTEKDSYFVRRHKIDLHRRRYPLGHPLVD